MPAPSQQKRNATAKPMRKPRGPRAPKATKGNHNKPEIYGYFGSTGSRKTTALRAMFETLDRRLTMVFSPKEEFDDYAGYLKCKAVRSIPEVVAEVKAGRDVVFWPKSLNRDQITAEFEFFCQIALKVAPCTLIPEELHLMTRPNAAPDSWKVCNLMGRASALRIMGASQRPCSVDKEFFGNLSYAWCGRQNYEDDAKVTAKLVLCKQEEILQLEQGEFKERTM